LFGTLQQNAPLLTAGLRYHSLTETPGADLLYERIQRPLRLRDANYNSAMDVLTVNNVDGQQDGDDSFVIALSGLLEDYVINGHSPYPVSRKTGKVASLNDDLPWGIVYPSPSLRAPIHIPGIFAAIPPIKNYYHLLVDHLMPIVATVLRNPQRFTGPITFVVREDYAIVDFVTGILREKGFDVRIRRIAAADTVTGDFYLWAKTRSRSTEHGYAFREELDLIGDAIDKRIAHLTTPKRIFILRTKTKLRNLVNQEEIQSGLVAKGFTPFELKWSNFLEQIAAFRRAEQIVSVHGASLTNLMWGHDGHVREIFPNNARKTTYLHIASQNGWNYDYVLGSDEAERQNFRVSPEAVFAKTA